jgi:hypothetical protein
VNVGAGTLRLGTGTGSVFSGFEAFGGTSGADRFIDGALGQTYAGGFGADTFLFSSGLAGADRITDFQAVDVIRLKGFGTGLDSFADVLSHTTDVLGSGALIQTGLGSSILLVGVTVAQLQTDDFAF